MRNLTIAKTSYTPDINFNKETGILEIMGKSYPENTFEFYKPIVQWISDYIKNTENEKTVLNCSITYLNSSSLKAYFDILDILEEASSDGKNIEVNWMYDADDDIIEETGEDFQDDFEDLTINLVPKD